MLRVAIVEDDASFSAQLQVDTERCFKELGQAADITVFPDGLEIVEDYQPVWDIILMDIEMPHLDGMSAAHRIREQDPAVVLIFITNMARYAIKGYEVDAMDFVLKPVEYAQLALKLKKAMGMVEQRQRRYLMVHLDGEKQRIATNDILFIEVINHLLHIPTAKEEYVVAGTLQKIENDLAGLPFFRCSHSFVVNLANITAVRKETVLVGGQEIPVSRPNRRELLQRLSDYLGGGLR